MIMKVLVIHNKMFLFFSSFYFYTDGKKSEINCTAVYCCSRYLEERYVYLHIYTASQITLKHQNMFSYHMHSQKQQKSFFKSIKVFFVATDRLMMIFYAFPGNCVYKKPYFLIYITSHHMIIMKGMLSKNKDDNVKLIKKTNIDSITGKQR